jgi:hypothetical protein
LLGEIKRTVRGESPVIFHPPGHTDTVRVVGAAHETPAVIRKLSFHEFIVISFTQIGGSWNNSG